MSQHPPILYFDLGSPYAYLACERARAVLGTAPELRPVLLGAIFSRRGFGSWSATPGREQRIAEIESRARRYGLAPLRWPAVWPANGLEAMRAATWAKQQGAAAPFAQAVFRQQFAHGADIAERSVLLECATRAGLDADHLSRALGLPEIKRALRDASEAAWDGGVRGVPSVKVGESIFFGDDQLELAVGALNASPSTSS